MHRTLFCIKSFSRCEVPGLEHRWMETRLFALEMAFAICSSMYSDRPVPSRFTCCKRLFLLIKLHRLSTTYVESSENLCSISCQGASLLERGLRELCIIWRRFRAERGCFGAGENSSTTSSFPSTILFQERFKESSMRFSPSERIKLM